MPTMHSPYCTKMLKIAESHPGCMSTYEIEMVKAFFVTRGILLRGNPGLNEIQLMAWQYECLNMTFQSRVILHR